MALDEAILQTVRDDRSPSTLRLYSWEPACLSLGYAQPLAEVDAMRLHEYGWDIVRRPTGGRAILHSDELTYMVAGPARDPMFAGGVLPTYRRISQALVSGLLLLGLEPVLQPETSGRSAIGDQSNPVCFEVPSSYEITVAGRKLLGSAQVRRRGGVMQHGSLPLSGDITRICQVLRFQDPAAREQAAKRLFERAATLEMLLGKPVSWERAADSLVQGFSQTLGLHFVPSKPSPEEDRLAEDLMAKRYANSDWTRRV